MAFTRAVPTAEPGLAHYLEEIRRFPMLDRQEELVLAKRWCGMAIATRRTRLSPAISGW